MKHPVEIEESYNLFLKEYPDVLTQRIFKAFLVYPARLFSAYYIQVRSKASKWEETFVSPKSICFNIWG